MTPSELVSLASVARPRRRRRIEIAPSYRSESRTPSVCRKGALITGAADVWRAAADIQDATQEHVLAFDLNTRHRVIARRVVAIGTLSGVEIHPREVFRAAITNGAAAIVLVHNHPSGDSAPSKADIELTARVRQVGELVGIMLLDHVVVGGDGYTSIAKTGWR